LEPTKYVISFEPLDGFSKFLLFCNQQIVLFHFRYKKILLLGITKFHPKSLSIAASRVTGNTEAPTDNGKPMAKGKIF
jgi:hypothetical protein